MTLDATDTDTIGHLLVAIHESGALPVWQEYHILAANVYDSLFGAATDKLDVNVEEWNTTAVPPEHTAGYPIVTVKDGAGTGEINTNAGKVVGVELVDVLTTYTGNTPQTGNVYTLVDTEVAAILAAVDTEVAAIKATTDQLTFGTANRVNVQVYGVETDSLSAAGLAASAIAEIQAGLSTLDAAGVRTAVGMASANLDTQLTDLPTNAELATALGTADDAVLAAIATVQADTDNIQTRIPAALVSGRIDASVGAMAANTFTASALATDAVTEIQSGLGAGLDAAGVRAAVGLASANLDTQLDALPTTAELATALGTADDAIIAAIAALNNLSSAQTQTAAAAALTAYGASTYLGGDTAGTTTLLSRVPGTVQPQTGDAYARLGAPVGASLSADLATKATPAQILTTALTEAYAADGAAPTLSQLMFLALSALTEFAISGVTITTKKLDGISVAATYTMDSATDPTSRTRAT